LGRVAVVGVSPTKRRKRGNSSSPVAAAETPAFEYGKKWDETYGTDKSQFDDSGELITFVTGLDASLVWLFLASYCSSTEPLHSSYPVLNTHTPLFISIQLYSSSTPQRKP
jgi:hypothetical protein